MRRYQTSLGIKLYSCESDVCYSCQPTWPQCKSPDKECRTSCGTSCGGTCYILRQKTLEIPLNIKKMLRVTCKIQWLHSYHYQITSDAIPIKQEKCEL